MLNGGAGTAALRLHLSLLKMGISSTLCCAEAANLPPKVVLTTGNPLFQWYLRNLAKMEYHVARLRNPTVTPPIPASLFGGIARSAIEAENPDIVNLHWIDNSFVSISDLKWLAKRKIPLVWTLHDMTPLSGGFSYREIRGLPPASFGPLVISGNAESTSNGLMTRRAKALRDAKITAVSPSEWLAEEARQSMVFSKHQVECIPNGLDLTRFQAHPKNEAKHFHRLPLDRKIILFGADGLMDPRKGAVHFRNAAVIADRTWDPSVPKPVIAVFGNTPDTTQIEWPWETHYIGKITDQHALSLLYSAADVFICPSREDNLPNTVIESLASGTPVVGFKIGGLPDMIKNDITGKLVDPYDESLLAEALKELCSKSLDEARKIQQACRNFAESNFSADLQARRYVDVYKKLLQTG